MNKFWSTTTNPYSDIKKEIFNRMDDHNRIVEEYLRYDVLSTMKTALGICDLKDMIKDVIFNPPATIVLWKDGTKTVVKEQDGYEFNPWVGMAMACSKKMLGNKGNYFEVFKKYCEPYEEKMKKEEALHIMLNAWLSAHEESYNPVDEAYMQINNFLNGKGSLDLDEIRGLLGEALE